MGSSFGTSVAVSDAAVYIHGWFSGSDGDFVGVQLDERGERAWVRWWCRVVMVGAGEMGWDGMGCTLRLGPTALGAGGRAGTCALNGGRPGRSWEKAGVISPRKRRYVTWHVRGSLDELDMAHKALFSPQVGQTWSQE